MFKKLEEIERRFEEIGASLADPKVLGASREVQRLSKEYARIKETVEAFRTYRRVEREIEENRALLDDPDLGGLAKSELTALEKRRGDLEEDLKRLLTPRDPNDDRNLLLEIRAGTGGEEAALFASDLLRMYTRYAERRGWTVELLSHNPTGLGGIKEAIVLVRGDGAYARLKFESGVHRVQRVPVTESSGRIHTSTVTVAVLPEAEEVEVEIRPEELRIDVYRSSGHGGQSVNTTDSAVRVTHLPTGLVVACQDERSQHQNRAKALQILRARLLKFRQDQQASLTAAERRAQVGTGERSEKIRTYNFPQGRVTDHRAGITLHRIQEVLDGDIDPLIEGIIAQARSESLAAPTAPHE